MRKLLCFSLFSVAFLAAALAGEHGIPQKDSIATVNIPDKWKAVETEEGLDISSDDDEIYINIEANDSESIEGAIQEAFGYLKKSKVTIDKATEKKQETKFHGMDLVNFDWDGKDSDGACKVSLTIFGVTKTKGMLMLYWASPEGEKKHAKELLAIQESIKPVAK